MFSVWSRVALLSITVVRPGVFRAASRIADFTCADATGLSYSIGSGERAPRSSSGRRPRPPASKDAPMRESGRITRSMGRRQSDASPVTWASSGWVARRPITSRAPVPELPKSSTAPGSARPPTPAPSTIQAPSSSRIPAPSAASADAVRSTSSASRSPSMRVRPTALAPMISARCEIDLSPGTRMRPPTGPARVDCSAATPFPRPPVQSPPARGGPAFPARGGLPRRKKRVALPLPAPR